MWSKKMKDALKVQKDLLALAEKEGRGLTEDEKARFAEAKATIEEAREMIAAQNDVEGLSAELTTEVATVPATPVVEAEDKVRPYATFAEQLKDIKAAATGNVSEKLKKLQNAQGLNEGVGSDGGYAVQDDFLGLILDTAVETGEILSRVDAYNVSGNSNRVSWTEVDEKDVSADIAGGVQVYWLAEAAEATKSKPKFKGAELKLEKLMGLAYVTYELDSDSNFIGQFLERTFATAIERAVESAIVSGDGVGKPTGILTGGGLVEVTKVSGQTAGTLVWKNITAMYNQAYQPRSGGWVWLAHPDCADQLDNMNQEVGTAGVPVYQAANMTTKVDMLRGLPVIYTDHCSALGTKGDIILADLSDYLLPIKGGVRTDVSMHVAYETAEDAYRFIFRVNGRPKTTNQLTIKNSTKKRGKYVTVATRA